MNIEDQLYLHNLANRLENFTENRGFNSKENHPFLSDALEIRELIKRNKSRDSNWMAKEAINNEIGGNRH